MSTIVTPSQDFYSMADFGYYDTGFVTPRMALEILLLPTIWDQIGLEIMMVTFVWAATSTVVSLFPPAVIILTSAYVHSLIFLMKAIELDPEVNVAELRNLEQQGEELFLALALVDISIASAALVIVGIAALTAIGVSAGVIEGWNWHPLNL